MKETLVSIGADPKTNKVLVLSQCTVKLRVVVWQTKWYPYPLHGVVSLDLRSIASNRLTLCWVRLG